MINGFISFHSTAELEELFELLLDIFPILSVLDELVLNELHDVLELKLLYPPELSVDVDDEIESLLEVLEEL